VKILIIRDLEDASWDKRATADVVLLTHMTTGKIHVFKDRWGERGRVFESIDDARRHYALMVLAGTGS
jgi:hypothetical protein